MCQLLCGAGSYIRISVAPHITCVPQCGQADQEEQLHTAEGELHRRGEVIRLAAERSPAAA